MMPVFCKRTEGDSEEDDNKDKIELAKLPISGHDIAGVRQLLS